MKRRTRRSRTILRLAACACVVALAACSTASADDPPSTAPTTAATSTAVSTSSIEAATPEPTDSADTGATDTETTDPETTDTDTASASNSAPGPTNPDTTDPDDTDPDDTGTNDTGTNDTGTDDTGTAGPDPYSGEDPDDGATTSTVRTTRDTTREPIEEPTVTTATVPPGPVHSPAVFDPTLPNLTAAFNSLIDRNAAVSVSVWRDHSPIFAESAGVGVSGQPVTAETPMLVASVSKLITSLTISRLAAVGAIQVDAAVPWDSMSIAHDPAWNDITVRQLLDHTSGMPKAQKTWLNDPGSCAIPLAAAMAGPPTISRGTWLYSNGNYCALGLLIEAVTGVDRGTAARSFVFDPIHVAGPHLSTDGQLPSDGPYAKGVARLDRLGGAGTWMSGSDDLAAMLDSVTKVDLMTMTYPAVMIDQYGWGHTGTVDGAKACAWVIDQGRTVVVGIVAGERPSTGGRVCDVLIPALAADLGIWADRPHRFPE